MTMERLSSFEFAAMGSTCAVSVLGGRTSVLSALAFRRCADLEDKWSRFRSSSELSRLCADAPVTRRVSHDTCLLIDRGVYAWRATNGLFDPSVLSTMVASGYDRSFEKLPPTIDRTALSASVGCHGIAVDPSSCEVTMPAGVGFDPGGIGKGLAADLLVEALLDAGAEGACVSVGGDLRVSGEVPDDGWPIGVANPFDADDLMSVVLLADHGMATSNRLLRRWIAGDEERNHLIDPRSGRSANGPVSATVIAGEAWWAEALTKVALLDVGSARTKLALLGAAALVTHADGRVETIGHYERFERPRVSERPVAV